jgi:hypothetical protein
MLEVETPWGQNTAGSHCKWTRDFGGWDFKALHHSRCGMAEDHKEASIAFVEKRAPVFKGR